MNLILLSPSDLLPGSNLACLSGRRLRHVLEVLKPKLNDTLTVGLENGLTGEGQVIRISRDAIELKVLFQSAPPAKLPVVLCCALMRPPVFRRVLQTATAMGVRELHFFHTRRVEKSFWQSTSLRDKEIREELALGLEQAKDTVFPIVQFHKRFKPFVEDVLPGLLKDREGIVADPSGEHFGTWHLALGTRGTIDSSREAGVTGFFPSAQCPVPSALVLGPEGGFIPFEITMFREAGCRIVSLGERILRVETAVVALLAKLY